MRIVKFIALCGMLFLFSLCYLHLVGAADMPDAGGGGLAELTQYGVRVITPTSNNVHGFRINEITTTKLNAQTVEVDAAGGGSSVSIVYDSADDRIEANKGIAIIENSSNVSSIELANDSVNSTTKTSNNVLQFVGKTPVVNFGITPTQGYALPQYFLPPQNRATGFPADLVDGYTDLVIKPSPKTTAAPEMNAVTATYYAGSGNLKAITQRLTATENLEIRDIMPGRNALTPATGMTSPVTHTNQFYLTSITRTYNRDPMAASVNLPTVANTLTYATLWGTMQDGSVKTGQLLISHFVHPSSDTTGVNFRTVDGGDGDTTHPEYDTQWTYTESFDGGAGATTTAKLKKSAAGRYYLELVAGAGAAKQWDLYSHTANTFSPPQYLDISFTFDGSWSTSSSSASVISFGVNADAKTTSPYSTNAVMFALKANAPTTIYCYSSSFLMDSYTHTSSLIETKHTYRIVYKDTLVKFYLDGTEIMSFDNTPIDVDDHSYYPFIFMQHALADTAKTMTINLDSIVCGAKAN